MAVIPGEKAGEQVAGAKRSRAEDPRTFPGPATASRVYSPEEITGDFRPGGVVGWGKNFRIDL